MNQLTLAQLSDQLSHIRSDMSVQLELNQTELRDGVESLIRRYQLQNQQIRTKAASGIRRVEEAIRAISEDA